ncbi:MAG: hypothetical protein VXX04_04865 [Actinomycetota bacterium]|nr:hypothetical protein [Actinomycetota bacterium]
MTVLTVFAVVTSIVLVALLVSLSASEAARLQVRRGIRNAPSEPPMVTVVVNPDRNVELARISV